MRDLDFFRNNQHAAPRWAVQKHPGIVGASQSDSRENFGKASTLTGRASFAISDPNQPGGETIVWGQEIKVEQGKDHIFVDDVKIVLPSAQKTQIQESSSEHYAATTSQNFFSSAPQARTAPNEDDQQKQLIASLQNQLRGEVIKKYFGLHGNIQLITGEVQYATTDDDNLMLTYKAQMMRGIDRDGKSVSVSNVNATTTVKLAPTSASNPQFGRN